MLLPYMRVRGEVRLTPRQSLSVLAAPLSIDASGMFDRPIDFAGAHRGEEPSAATVQRDSPPEEEAVPFFVPRDIAGVPLSL